MKSMATIDVCDSWWAPVGPGGGSRPWLLAADPAERWADEPSEMDAANAAMQRMHLGQSRVVVTGR